MEESAIMDYILWLIFLPSFILSRTGIMEKEEGDKGKREIV